jgi:hypothetical protein
MALLNYTTQIAAEKTVMEIQQILAVGGASAIATEYSNGAITAVSFRIATPFGLTTYSLPCDIAAVQRILEKQSQAGKVPPRLVTYEQAARVGWRIVKDWIEAQLALVQTQMVTIDQVFLPYARTPGGETVYQRYLNAGMSGLAMVGQPCAPSTANRRVNSADAPKNA